MFGVLNEEEEGGGRLLFVRGHAILSHGKSSRTSSTDERGGSGAITQGGKNAGEVSELTDRAAL